MQCILVKSDEFQHCPRLWRHGRQKNVDKYLEVKTTHKNLDIYREHALALNSGHVWMTI